MWLLTGETCALVLSIAPVDDSQGALAATKKSQAMDRISSGIRMRVERLRSPGRRKPRNRSARFASGLPRVEAGCAAGVDGETWKSYGQTLGANLQDLSNRVKRGAYRARPVRRAYNAKADGRQPPLGVPALEDKLVQRAVVEVSSVEEALVALAQGGS